MPTSVGCGQSAESLGPELTFQGITLSVAGLLIAWRPPLELMLPVVSLILLASGFALSLAVLRLPAERAASYNVAAGALVFIGFGAAILSDTRDLTPLLTR